MNKVKKVFVLVLIAAIVSLGLPGCIVSHDNHIAPKHIDNLFLHGFELDRLDEAIPVILQAGTVEEPVVVSTRSIRFEQDGALVKASLKIEWESVVDDTWQATVKFQSERGSTLARSDIFFKTSRLIEKYAGLHSESLHFALGPFCPLTDLSKVKHFLLTIQPAGEQLTAAVQAGGGDSWGLPHNGLQIRLIIPKTQGENIPVLTPEKYTARLEVRNTTSQSIGITVSNGQGVSYESANWLLGLYIDVRSQDGEEYVFLRADDFFSAKDSWYWINDTDESVSSVPAGYRPIEPRKTVIFEIRMDRLLLYVEETNLLNLRDHFEVRPVISFPENITRWHGKVFGEYIPVSIRPPDVPVEGDRELVVYSAQDIVDSVVDELDNVTDYSATVFNGVNIPLIRDMLAGRLQWKRASGNWKGKMQEGMPYSKIHITDGVSWKCIDEKGSVKYYSNAVYGSYIRSAYGTDMFNMENILSNETWAKDPSTVTINGVLCYRVYTAKENENYEVWIDEATRTKVIRVTATDEIDQLLWQLDYGDYSDVENTAWLPGKVVTKRYLEDMTVQFVSTYRFSNVHINSGLSDAVFAVDRVLPKGRPDKKTRFMTREMPDPNPAQLKEYLPYLTKGVIPLCDLLRAESTLESVEMLHQIGEYTARHPAYVVAGVPLFHDNGPYDVEQIMSNRRFLKILKVLGSMSKSQASLIVNREINKTLPLYLSMLDEKVDRCRVAGKVRGGGQMSNNPDKSPVFGGLRFKILALIFTAGNLGLDETQPAVLNVARVAITQRKQWYYSREFRRIERGKMLSQSGLYNRQILVTGLFGTSGRQEKGMEDMLETVDIECQERKLTHFDSSATVHDFYARICGIPVDYSGGEQIVKFPEAIDDKSFDAILKAMDMEELLKIRYSKKE